MTDTIAIQAAEKLLERRNARRDLVAWSRLCGYEPAAHHRMILEKLALVEKGELKRLIIMCPPGSAKSTYTSLLFVPHYLANNPGHTLLCFSYSATFAEQWGKKCRNLIAMRQLELGYDLKADSRASSEWETTNNGRYFCAGAGAGIAGNRAHMILIDDFVGNKEDAFSDAYNEKIWSWFISDIKPRMLPSAAVVIICNHRHHQDLVGKLLETEPQKWDVISFPFFAEENDILGRKVGDRLWPEWFTEEQAEDVKKHPEMSGLYQQRPTPESGDFFKRKWIDDCMYDPFTELPYESELSFYCASDHAVSEEQRADYTCLLPVAFDSQGVIWILPDIFWDRVDTSVSVNAMIAMMKRRNPRIWWAEKGQISKSIGPFLKEEQKKQRIFNYVEQVTPSREKKARAQAIHGMMQIGMVRWPRGTTWLEQAVREMMEFPVGKHDDFVDALAYIGMGLERMIPGPKSKEHTVKKLPSLEDFTLNDLKTSDSQRRNQERLALMDN